MEDLVEFEGTWEEIARHADELAGHRVRVTVLPKARAAAATEPIPAFRAASGQSILRHTGTWSGDDLEACLRDVQETRAPLEF